MNYLSIASIFSIQGELERFPFAALRNPVAISKPDKREVYNNLVLLTVVETHENPESPAHMHIFLAGSVPVSKFLFYFVHFFFNLSFYIYIYIYILDWKLLYSLS